MSPLCGQLIAELQEPNAWALSESACRLVLKRRPEVTLWIANGAMYCDLHGKYSGSIGLLERWFLYWHARRVVQRLKLGIVLDGKIPMTPVAVAEVQPCKYCGMGHAVSDEGCPRIRAIYYWWNGRVRCVELMTMYEMWESVEAGYDFGARFGYRLHATVQGDYSPLPDRE